MDGQAAISAIKTAFEVVAINPKLKWLNCNPLHSEIGQ
jgi:hypothetical protein